MRKPVTGERPDKTLLVLSQVYVPDPASVGQYLADAAAEMARRGWRVVVLTANRGYDDPSVVYPPREVIDGVEVVRLPLSSFGKKSIPRRIFGGVSFIIQSVLRGVFTRGLSRVLVSTSPPMCPLAALVIAALRRVSVTYWVMDLNPDQMIALGKIGPRSVATKLFNTLNRWVLRRAAGVVTLDTYMADRLIEKAPAVERKLSVIPPWPHQHIEPIEHDQNPFRAQHGLSGKFVIMYSGNMSIASPLNTVLEAALRLTDEPDLLFMFIGGGLGRQRVQEVISRHSPANIVLLPYQPLERIRYSLSAADVHLVAMGNAIVGVCHPSKVYGAMAAARPILLLGPQHCHIADIIDKARLGWRIAHGDTDGAEQTIRRIVHSDPAELVAMGERARQMTADRYSKAALCGAMCDVIESESIEDQAAGASVE